LQTHSFPTRRSSDLWPRSLHASLVEKLSSNGAAAVAFDVIFADKHSAREDNLFAQALRKTHNVVLCEAMKVENVFLTRERGLPGGELDITKVLSPILFFSQSAVATAPFPVPKVSNKVSQYWMFTAAGEKPTLPVAAFQVFMVQVYDDFISLLEKVSPEQASRLPSNKGDIMERGGIERLIRNIRHIFQSEPLIAGRMLYELHNSKTLSSDMRKNRMIDSLIGMYRTNSHSQYLNFYGPARTITTIPYYKVLQMGGGSSGGIRSFDIKGKAVFVGLSQLSPVDQKESFFTVYSQRQGLDISGIEIVATAFANLLENVPVKPVDFRLYLVIIFLWGILLGFICKRFSTRVSSCSMIVLMTLYTIFAVYHFKHNGIWYPVISTVFFQPVAAFFGGLLWNYADVKQERQNMRKALGFYLPDDVADGLTRDVENIHSSHQIVFGICLSTDAEQYSSLAEVMPPKELGSFMNKYYETIFRPIKQHGGIISDVIGDSALAIWISSHPEAVLRQKACLAALDIW